MITKLLNYIKKSAKGGYSDGIKMLKYCYQMGIGTNVNKQKAYELHKHPSIRKVNINFNEPVAVFVESQNKSQSKSE
jgi:hypothetical protein